MRREEILEYIRENPLFQLATVEGDSPRVRSIMMYRVDEEGIVFSTDGNKDLHRQLQANPKVELCFVNQGENTQARIRGDAGLLDDMELKKQIVEDYPFLKPWIEQAGWDAMVVYQVKKGVATYWTMEKAFAEKEFVKLF